MSPLASRLTRAFVLLAFGSAASAQILFGPARVTVPLPGTEPTDSVGVADVDGDGLLDLVRAVDLDIRWHAGDGTGAFAKTGTLLPVSGDRVCLVDLNGDGRRDLLAATLSTASLEVALAHPVSGFGPPVAYETPPNPTHDLVIATGDADADGDTDVLLVARGVFVAAPGEAWLLLNDGTGALTLGPLVTGDATHQLDDGFIASVDGDSSPDLVLVSTASGQPPETAVWQGQPGGGMATSFRVQGHKLSRAADLDSDGDIDLVAATHQDLAPAFISTFLGDGRGDFTVGPVTDLGLGVQQVDIDLADLDDDGTPDLVLAVPLNDSAWMLEGEGTGGFGEPDARVTLTSEFAVTRIVAVDDFDLDGRLDVLCNEVHHADVAVTLNATYPTGGPLLDLGHQLEHGPGWPILIATGSFVGGEAVGLDLYRAGSNQAVFLVIGFSLLEAPFKGGTMVPTPQLIAGPWMASGLGELHLSGHWPNGVPSGFPVVLQCWISAPPSPADFGASSGVLITAP